MVTDNPNAKNPASEPAPAAVSTTSAGSGAPPVPAKDDNLYTKVGDTTLEGGAVNVRPGKPDKLPPAKANKSKAAEPEEAPAPIDEFARRIPSDMLDEQIIFGRAGRRKTDDGTEGDQLIVTAGHFRTLDQEETHALFSDLVKDYPRDTPSNYTVAALNGQMKLTLADLQEYVDTY